MTLTSSLKFVTKSPALKISRHTLLYLHVSLHYLVKYLTTFWLSRHWTSFLRQSMCTYKNSKKSLESSLLHIATAMRHCGANWFQVEILIYAVVFCCEGETIILVWCHTNVPNLLHSLKQDLLLSILWVWLGYRVIRTARRYTKLLLLLGRITVLRRCGLLLQTE